MSTNATRKSVWKTSWLAEGLTFLGGIVYFVQSWIYTHTQSSILDEGAYLLKGLMYARGQYFPYQDYGFWTNHMPLSFLIPGYVQVLFGPGIRTGRYLALVLGVLMVLGTWILARRLGGRWWAFGAVWLLALNIHMIKVYSVFATQGLIACMLVWVLVLTMGPDRPPWQLYLGTALAGLTFLTRINMAPVLPLLIIYIFWQYGKKFGLWSLVIGVLIVGIGHAFFWPNILRLWLAWLPLDWISFFKPWSQPQDALPNWNPDTNFNDRVQSLFQSIRLHFFGFFGFIVTWILAPAKKKWRSPWRFRVAVLLSALFSILFVLHGWASLWKNYCVYCLKVYMAFFSVLGIMLVIVSASSWQWNASHRKRWLSYLLIVILSLGIGYSLIPVWGSGLINPRFVRRVLKINVPRMESFRIQPGSIELWSLLANKFGWEELSILDFTITASRLIVFLSLALLFAWLIIRFGSRLTKAVTNLSPSQAAGALLTFLILGTLVTFSVGLSPYDRDCGWNVIASYEAGGEHLAEQVPPGSKVYWWGGLSAVPLLYIPNVDIYPPQINHGYSYRLGGQPDDLVRYGWWSKELAHQWAQEADVLLIEARLYGTFPTNIAESETFDEVPPTPPMVPCRSNSSIHIFIREH
jgi:hypothetical protein